MPRYRMSISGYSNEDLLEQDKNPSERNNLFLAELEFEAAHIIDALSTTEVRFAAFKKDLVGESDPTTFIVFLSQRVVWKKFPFSKIEKWFGVHCFIDQTSIKSSTN